MNAAPNISLKVIFLMKAVPKSDLASVLVQQSSDWEKEKQNKKTVHVLAGSMLVEGESKVT